MIKDKLSVGQAVGIQKRCFKCGADIFIKDHSKKCKSGAIVYGGTIKVDFSNDK